MRVGLVKYDQMIAGTITETDDGKYIFQYDSEYIKNYPSQFITFQMPVRAEPYVSTRLFSFFNGLIPEGWLLNIAIKKWGIQKEDRMGLLLSCCRNCIGAVSIYPLK